MAMKRVALLVLCAALACTTGCGLRQRHIRPGAAGDTGAVESEAPQEDEAPEESTGKSVDVANKPLESSELTSSQVRMLAREVGAPLATYGYFQDTGDTPETKVFSLTDADWERFLRATGSMHVDVGSGDTEGLAAIFGSSFSRDFHHVRSNGMFTGTVDTADFDAYFQNAFGFVPDLPGVGSRQTEFEVGSGDDPSCLELDALPDSVALKGGAGRVSFTYSVYETPDYAGKVTATLWLEQDDDDPYGCHVTAFSTAYEEAPAEAPPTDFVFPDSSTRYLTASDYDRLFASYPAAHDEALSAEEALGIARNEIYARHGNKFDNKTYQRHFGQFEWYNPTHKVSDSELNAIEKANVATIQEWEALEQSPMRDTDFIFPDSSDVY